MSKGKYDPKRLQELYKLVNKSKNQVALAVLYFIEVFGEPEELVEDEAKK